MTKEEFYQELLGLPRPWRVERVVLDKAVGRVDVWLTHPDGLRWNCPCCQAALAVYDHVPERVWRHLDTCEYGTFLHARLPRVACPKHGVVQVGAAWAEGDSKSTVAMESRCIDVLRECDVSGAGRLLRLGWERLWEVVERAVARGRDRKAHRLPRYIGVDEKSFAKGHQYETLVCDLRRGTVEYVEDERKEATLASYFAGFSEAARARVIAVAMDMWDPYIAAVRKAVPGGEEKIVFDRFHVMRHVSKAVDDVRRREHKELWSRGDGTLKGTRYLWLWNPENIPKWRLPDFEALRKKDLKVGRAWAIKENLRQLWACGSEEEARTFFARWYGWAMRSRLAPVVKAARTLKHYVGGVLRFLRHRITNACVEGLNSKIETIKKMACGFRNREHYKTAIYFHCGGLDLHPVPAT
ncbi:MAG: ISL3 family transposase [Planctomycetes bacterium]|nr:ISL3 family transposase [Planctomycetota bacterium]